jgi:hypothetical protein
MFANWVDISSSLPLHEAFGTYIIPASILRVLLVDNADTPHNRQSNVFVWADDDMVRIDFAAYEHETPKIIEGV